jgi:hypothetical protein
MLLLYFSFENLCRVTVPNLENFVAILGNSGLGLRLNLGLEESPRDYIQPPQTSMILPSPKYGAVSMFVAAIPNLE